MATSVPEVPGIAVEQAQAEADSATATKFRFKTFDRVYFEEPDEETGKTEIVFDVVNEKEGTAAEKAAKDAIAKGDTEAKTYVHNKKKYKFVGVEPHSFKVHATNNDAGQKLLVPDEKERAKMFNRGLSTKQDNKIRAMLAEMIDGPEEDEEGNKIKVPKFTLQAEPYDMREFLKEESRTRQTPEEKILEQINQMSLPPSVLKAFYAALDAKKAQMSASAVGFGDEEEEEEAETA